MATPVRLNERTGLTALGTVVAKLYPLDNDGLVSGPIANGAAGDACTEIETYVYEATVAELLTGWHKVIVELDGSAITTTYILMTPNASTHWCGDYAGPHGGAAVGGMIASYPSLLERVGHYLFGIRSGFSLDQTDDIEECLKDGLHDVYTAHSWSFFRPVKEITTTAPYSTGTITIASGVVTLLGGTFPSWAAVGVLKVGNDYYDVDTRDGDTQVTLEDTTVTLAVASSFELGRPEYDLPTAFEAIEGDLAYEPGQSDFYPPVRQKDDGEILRLCQDDPYHDRPLYYGIRTVEFDPTVGSLRRLALYPTPDAAYVLKARMKLRTTMIDETNCYPVGAESLSQLITEACLAAAERGYDEQEGRHTKRFQELLPLAIAADQEMTSPTSLGSDSPQGEESDWWSSTIRMGAITLNGVTL